MLDAIRSFPAITLIRFLDNHGLLSLNAQPTWQVVAGGSDIYVPGLMAPVSSGIHLGAQIDSVRVQIVLAETVRSVIHQSEALKRLHG